MKTCPVCGRTLDELNFGNSNVCKSCRRQYRALYRKLKCLAYLGNHCSSCGRNDAPVLTFHHVDPKTKKFNIAEWISGQPSTANMTWEDVKKELDKCVIACFNCHRLIHNSKRELKDYIPYLTKKQRQELESDVIRDDELFELMEDDEMVRDVLMEPMEDSSVLGQSVYELSHTAQKKRTFKSEISNVKKSTERLVEASNREMAKRPGGLLGITPPGKRKPEFQKTCCYCGESFSTPNENQLFCSDYCQEEAREFAEENGNIDVFNYLVTNGIQMTGSIYRIKQKELFNLLGFAH